jgi:hypothetical protein
MIILCSLLYSFAIVLTILSSVRFLLIKEYHLYLRNLKFLYILNGAYKNRDVKYIKTNKTRKGTLKKYL